MDPLGALWAQSPSGSGAQEPWPDVNENPPSDEWTSTYDSFTVDTVGFPVGLHGVQTPVNVGDFDPENEALAVQAYGASELAPGQLMSTKVPPAWSGKGSWFAYEELVYDWVDITVLDKDKQGPALRTRLFDAAVIYKSSLDRERLKDKDTGVEYFLKTIRPNFVKGVQNVFLYRLIQFLSQRRQKLDIHRWIAKFELQRKRLYDAWMDLITPITSTTSPKYNTYFAKVDEYCTRTGRTRPQEQALLVNLVNDIQTHEHKTSFPFSDNLITLIFIMFSQLNEQQRLMMTQHMQMKMIQLEDYTFPAIRSWFLETLVIARSQLEDPSVQDRNQRFTPRPRSFIVLDEGECEGCFGVWAEDFDSGIEGFLEPYDDVFWTFDEDNCSWIARRFAGRRYVRGKGKGRKGRSRFRSKGKSKGKGRPYAVMPDGSYGPYGSESEWSSADWTGSWDESGWMTDPNWSGESWDQGTWPSVNTGMADATKGKGKFKGKFKGPPKGHPGKGPGKDSKGGKDKGKAKAGKANVTDVQPGAVDTATPYNPEQAQLDANTAANAAQSAQDWHWDQSYWAGYEWYPSQHGYGFPVFEHESLIAQQSFVTSDRRPYASITIEDKVKEYWTNVVVDLQQNPLCVILDLGCTRSMGSRRAVEAFEHAAWFHGITCEWKRCWTRMSFANSESAWLEWCVEVTFPTEPPISTTIDVHDQGNIPILMSLPQMMNLGLDLKCRPDSVTLTCEALGYHSENLPFTTSKHVALDLSRIRGKIKIDSVGEKRADTFCSHDASTEAPTEASVCYTDDESEWSIDEEETHDTLTAAVPAEGAAYPVRRRLSSKQSVNADRPESGVPVHKPPAKNKGKKRSSQRSKDKGDPDSPVKASVIDRPEPPVDGPEKKDGAKAPKPSKKKEPKGTDPTLGSTLEKIHAKLRDKTELYKLHLKHYHMSSAVFRKRTSALKIPKDIYDLYDTVVSECTSCQKFAPAPQRSKVSGLRAETFGDLWFLDHVDVSVDQYIYCVLVIVDAATNFIWAAPQKSKLHNETLAVIEQAFTDLNCRPKAVCADNYFMEKDFMQFYKYWGIRDIPLGPHTPWPNRAEAGVKLTKHRIQILVDALRRYEPELPSMRHVSVRHIIARACWARNMALTYGGKSPAEMALGRRPPDILDLENMMPQQLAIEPSEQQRLSDIIQTEALKAHLEARQRVDIRRDLIARLRPSDGPFEVGQSVWYWDRDLSKIRGGEWIASRVVAYEKPPMVTIDLKGQSVRVNQSKLRKNPDNWHDVVIPGLHGRDGTVTVPYPEQRLESKTSVPSVNTEPAAPSTPVQTGSAPADGIEYNPDASDDDWTPRSSPESPSRRSIEEQEELDLFGPDPDDPAVDLFDNMYNVHAPDVWVHGDGRSFRQYYSNSDTLSAVFSIATDVSVAEPISLHESSFEQCMQACETVSSRLIWISPPAGNDQYFASLSCKLAEHQMHNGQYFVIAAPWSSTLWNNEWMLYLEQYEGVSCTNIQLEGYDPSTRNYKTLCLMHNLTSKAMAPLVRKVKRDPTIRRTKDPTDCYPIQFCESVYTFVADAIRSQLGIQDQWPRVSPYQERVMDDILLDLTSSELALLNSVQTEQDKEDHGCGYHVHTVKEITLLSSLLVTDRHIKWFMTWVNSRPKGTILDFGQRHVADTLPKQLAMLRKMRNIYFPQKHFDHCQVFRGVVNSQLSVLQGSGNHAVVVMWKKNDKRKRVFASSIDSFRFEGFDPLMWSIVVYYNMDGTSSAGGNTKTPQSSPPSVAPSSPHVPPNPPQYADPNEPLPPLPPPDEHPENFPRIPTSDSSKPSSDSSKPSTRPKHFDIGEQSSNSEGRSRRGESSSNPDDQSIDDDIDEDNPYGLPDEPSEDASEDEQEPDYEMNEHMVPVEQRDRSKSRDDDQRDRSRSHDDPPPRRGRSRVSRSRDHTRARPSIRQGSRSHDDHEPRRRDDRSKSRDDDQMQPSIRRNASRDHDDRERIPAYRSRSRDDHEARPDRPSTRRSSRTGQPSSSSADVPATPIAGVPTATKSSSQAHLPAALKAPPAVPKPKSSSTSSNVKQENTSMAFASYWAYTSYQPDLFVLEDDDYWSLHSDSHKLSSVTSSFSFVRDMDESVIDISVLESLPSVNRTLYLDNSWHQDAHADEVMIDIEELPEWEQQSLLSAFRAIPMSNKFPDNRQHGFPEAKARKAPRKKVNAARREANVMEKRMYAKQFLEAKLAEYKSWSQENDVMELVDMRTLDVKNYITGRWVLTIKRDKEGNFLKCKARWVLRGFQDAQHWNLQTDSPTSTRPGFRLQCQGASIRKWDVGHIDLKTAFLQGEAFDHNRDVICQLPPEAGYPPYMGARLKRAAYGLNDAPRLWWNRLDKSLRSYGLVPTRADRCCYVLYSAQPSTRHVHWADDEQSSLAALADANRPVPAVWEAKSSARAAVKQNLRPAIEQFKSKSMDLEAALELLLDPITGSHARNKQVDGVLTIYVDDVFFTGNDRFHKTVIESLRRDFQVGSEDLNDVMFVGQRIRWIDKDKPGKAHIRVDQETKIEELTEVVFDPSLRDNIVCSKDLHTQFRSVLGSINWLQARTQYQSCYLFSRSASASAAPTIADVRALNKLVRKIRSEVVVLRFWPLKGTNLRIIGYPDAAFRNNADKSSQRGQAVFIAESRQNGKVDAKGSLVDYESQKIKRTVLSTTVAELYAFMKCFGTCQFLRGLWMDIFGSPADLHMRTDANNLVTTASTTHLPEQKETIHMINQLRHEACSGAIDDLAHVVSEDCLSDCLTKSSAKPQALMKSVDTGFLPNVDKHPPFRELMRDKHKAYASIREQAWECTNDLVSWLVKNLDQANEVLTFFTVPVRSKIEQYLVSGDASDHWWMTD